MNAFFIPRRKTIELLLLLLFLGIFYFLYPNVSAISLFAFGYVWNWSASNDLNQLFLNKRYRLSLIKLVVTLQAEVLKPFQRAPDLLKVFLRIFPAGLFWIFIVLINDSEMPWWSTFIGSLAFELVQLEGDFLRGRKENP